jgi:hypothetical protein
MTEPTRPPPPTALVICPEGHQVGYSANPEAVLAEGEAVLQAWCSRCQGSFLLAPDEAERIRRWAARQLDRS